MWQMSEALICAKITCQTINMFIKSLVIYTVGAGPNWPSANDQDNHVYNCYYRLLYQVCGS